MHVVQSLTFNAGLKIHKLNYIVQNKVSILNYVLQYTRSSLILQVIDYYNASYTSDIDTQRSMTNYITASAKSVQIEIIFAIRVKVSL